MTLSWALWAILSSAGVGIILMRDAGPRLLSLSEEHGPSLTDAIGVVLLVAGWVALDIASWRRRHLSPGRAVRLLTLIAHSARPGSSPGRSSATMAPGGSAGPSSSPRSN